MKKLWLFIWILINTTVGALTLGLILVGIPTLFAIWPAWTAWNWLVKVGVTAVWLVAAFLLALIARRRDETLDALTGSRRRRIRSARKLVFDELVTLLCEPGSFGLPENYEMTVYMPSGENDTLVPIYPPWSTEENGPDPRIFESGKGATGSAWEKEGMVLVTNAAVSDGKYGLDEEQRRHFQTYKTVVAAVMRDAFDEKVGVLTLLSREDDGAFKDYPLNVSRLRDLATVIGVLIADVFPVGSGDVTPPS